MRKELDYIFKPESVAVIGASTRKGTIGRETLHNLLSSEFNGKLFPVNPKAPVIHSIKAYSSVLDVPDAVDLAIIIVPKEEVPQVVENCGQKGVRGVVVISAGFSETGKHGRQLEDKVLRTIRRHGMRMIGPNCFGIVNTDPSVNLNATFGKTFPKPGKIAFITQSGAMGEAIMNQASELGVGFSLVASIGNKADISSNDILTYLKDDPNTDIILLYLENFGNPRNFTRIARELSKIKPIVAVKSGRTKLGARAASSHTGALAGLDVGVDAFFEQAGVMRVDTVEELFDVAVALSAQQIPKGNRVVVVTNAGGPGILATDALINNGMEMPALTPSTIKKLKQFSSAHASFANPMDMVAGAGGKQFRQTLDVIKTDKRYDTIIPIFVPPVTIDQLDVARNIKEAVEGCGKTVLACFMGAGEGSVGVDYLKANNIPVYVYPETIARTLRTIDSYRRWLQKPKRTAKQFRVKTDIVRRVIKDSLNGKPGAIVGEDAIDILRAYGIPAVRYKFADSPAETARVSRSVGYPVVLKIHTPTVLHKTELGGVMVDLRTDKEVKEAFSELKRRVGRLPKGESFSVAIQPMVQGGMETVIGMTSDPSFGPLMMVGLGGIYVEVMKDVSFRINPLSVQDARDMIRELRSFPLLTGFRGAPPVDLQTMEEALLRLSQLVRDFPCFSEIDINPFIVSPDPKNCCAVDARFIVAEVETDS